MNHLDKYNIRNTNINEEIPLNQKVLRNLNKFKKDDYNNSR
jgi:hypothetical protein